MDGADPQLWLWSVEVALGSSLMTSRQEGFAQTLEFSAGEIADAWRGCSVTMGHGESLRRELTEGWGGGKNSLALESDGLAQLWGMILTSLILGEAGALAVTLRGWALPSHPNTAFTKLMSLEHWCLAGC